MKKWLFLDDSPERHDGIRKIVQAFDLDVEITHVYTVEEAIYALHGHWKPFDCVFLDHDLDETDPDLSGYEVAHYIANHLLPECIPFSVVIHSHNPDGAKRMSQVLTDVGIKNTVVEFSVKGV